MAVRGFAIVVPQPEQIYRFTTFIDEELAPRQVNTLVLRVDYHYEYENHPELRDTIALSKKDVKNW